MDKVDQARSNGWTAIRRRSFLDDLAAGERVVVAAAHVDMSPSSAYRLYRRDRAFAAAWDAATVARFGASPMPTLGPTIDFDDRALLRAMARCSPRPIGRESATGS